MKGKGRRGRGEGPFIACQDPAELGGLGRGLLPQEPLRKASARAGPRLRPPRAPRPRAEGTGPAPSGDTSWGKPEESVCLTLSEPSRGGGGAGRQHQAQAEDGGGRRLSLHGVGASGGGTGDGPGPLVRTGPA